MLRTASRRLRLRLGPLAVQHRGMGTRMGSGTLLGITALCLTALGAGLGLGFGCGGKAVVDGPSTGSGGNGGTGGSTSTTTTWTTTIITTTTATTSTTSTTASECQQACTELFACTQVDDLCPALDPDSGPAFIAQCAVQCEQNPAMLALIDPQDCPGTIATLSSLSSGFDAACHGGG